jgi:hypothetical protein
VIGAFSVLALLILHRGHGAVPPGKVNSYTGHGLPEGMAGEVVPAEPNVLRRLRLPVALAVAGVIAVSWYVTWSTSDFTMALAASPAPLLGPGYLASSSPSWSS